MPTSTQVINQIFEIQNKLIDLNQFPAFERNFNRLSAIFESDGFIVQNPLHEIYVDSRTDCEANIVGQSSSKMKITKVLKPVIYQQVNGETKLVQKAVVLVEKN